MSDGGGMKDKTGGLQPDLGKKPVSRPTPATAREQIIEKASIWMLRVVKRMEENYRVIKMGATTTVENMFRELQGIKGFSNYSAVEVPNESGDIVVVFSDGTIAENPSEERVTLAKGKGTVLTRETITEIANGLELIPTLPQEDRNVVARFVSSPPRA